MTEDLGFLLLSIDNSPSCNAIFNLAQQIIQNNPYKQICVFNSVNNRINKNMVPVLHLNQAKFFHGNLFVFDTLSLIFARQFPNIKKILFYTTDYFWSGNSYGDYKDAKELFTTDNLEFISNSEQMCDIYEICWKKPIGISKEFNYDSIKNFI